MLTSSLQENIICMLAYHDKYASIVRSSIELSLYGGPYRTIASRCYDYIDKYKQPPKDHLPDILSDKLSDGTAEAKLYIDIVDQIHSTQQGLNTEYVINQLELFIKRQSLRSIAVELTKALQKDTEETLLQAEELIAKANQQTLKIFDPGTRLSDKQRSLAFIDTKNDCFPTGIPELDKRGFGPTRKEMWLGIGNAKAGKCVYEDEFVLLADGSYKQIKHLSKNETIFTLNNSKFELKKSNDHIFNGEKDVVKVTTRSGRQIIVTPTHPFLTKKGWKSLNEIGVGNSVAVSKSIPVFGNEIEDNFKLKILGYMIADGGMSKVSTPTFTKLDDEVANDMEECLKLFGDRLVQAKGKKGHFYIVGNSRVCNTLNYLRNNNLMEKKSNEKVIPDFVFRLTKPLVAEFLAALFVCDGSIIKGKKYTFEYSTTSRVLAFQVTHLLSRFGILAKVRERWQIVSGCDYVSWNISFANREYLQILRNEIKIGFNKGRKLDEYLSTPKDRIGRKSYLLTDCEGDIFYDEIKIIEPYGKGKVYDLSVPETHNFVVNDFVVHNSWMLMNLAKMALMHRCKVCHISLEMSEKRCAQRYFQALFAVSKHLGILQATKFKYDDQGRIIGFDDIQLTPKFSLEDEGIRGKLEKVIDKWAVRLLDNIFIKEFPTSTLSMHKLRAYLDSLEATQQFIPDLLIIDYPDLMKLDKNNLRLSIDEIYKELRGWAGERNIAVAIVSQSNRGGSKAKSVGIDNVAEAYSKIAHADCIVTYSATESERKLGLARLHVTGRNDADNLTVVISQQYGVGAFVVDSCVMTQWYHKDMVEKDE